MPPTPSESRKRLMHIPLAFGLVGEDGRDMTWKSVEGAQVEDGVIHVRKRRHSIRFSGIAARPTLSLNRGFSAPVTLSVEQKAEDRIFLAGHDSDPFARWQASNALFTDALIDASRRIRGGGQPAFPPELAALAGKIAGDGDLEQAYRALAIALPGEADVAREIGSDIDPDTIFAAREALAGSIAAANENRFRDLYESLRDNGDYVPDAAGAGRRALRNALLDYLSLLDGGAALAATHFAEAGNMTDRAAALTVLAHRHRGSSEVDKALAAFEARYGSDPLVMDKWFLIQASVPGPQAVETVRRLTAHRAFSMTNPNRVRALIGSFANANQTGFHRADGEGYRFFAEMVLEAERRNPQLAARLATAMRSWRSLEAGRREKARAALVSIAGAGNLSTDLRDIVERMLA